MTEEYATKEDVQDAKEEVALRIHVYSGILFAVIVFCTTAIFMANEVNGWWVTYLMGWFMLLYMGSYAHPHVNGLWNATFGRVDALHVNETLEEYNDE